MLLCRSVLCLNAAAILSPGGKEIKAYREMRRTRCSRALIMFRLSISRSVDYLLFSSVTFGESILAFERYPIRRAASVSSFCPSGSRVVQDISGRKWEIHQSPDRRPILELDARDEVIPKREGDRGRR